MAIELNSDTFFPVDVAAHQTEKPMSKPVLTSRRARTEQRKLMQQIVLFSVGALVLLLVFLFVIAPGAIRLVGTLFGGTAPIVSNDSIPPQVPILAAPVAATKSAELTLNGYGEANSKVILLLNGQPTGELVLPADGKLEQMVTLTEGENLVSAYAVDDAGNESSESKRYSVMLDTEAPKLELTQPQDKQQIELRKNQNLTITGVTEPHARIYINGRLALANDKGEFTATYLLSEGENKLEFKVQDQAGNMTEQVITVQFKL